LNSTDDTALAETAAPAVDAVAVSISVADVEQLRVIAQAIPSSSALARLLAQL
jgi:hypothetical protein